MCQIEFQTLSQRLSTEARKDYIIIVSSAIIQILTYYTSLLGVLSLAIETVKNKKLCQNLNIDTASINLF